MKERQLKYIWRRTWQDSQNDYTCEADGMNIGRVVYHKDGPVHAWRWFMAVDDLELRITPASGMEDDKIEASRRLEAAFDARNG